jgi:hypothetical protein
MQSIGPKASLFLEVLCFAGTTHTLALSKAPSQSQASTCAFAETNTCPLSLALSFFAPLLPLFFLAPLFIEGESNLGCEKKAVS